MAARYWVGGAGTWSSANTANWSATSGGAGGAGVPTSADTPTFDGNSGSGVVTFTNGGVTVSTTTINNVNIELSLGAAFLTGLTGSIIVTTGTFTTNNYTVTTGTLSSNNSNSRTISLGSSTVNLRSNGPLSFLVSTGLTFNSGTSDIRIESADTIFSGGDQTFYNLTYTGVARTRIVVTGSNIFNNITISGRTSAGIANVTFNLDQTINGTLTLSAGTNATMRSFVRSDTIGTTRTLTCAAVASLTDIDFRDITIAGAAAPVSGTRLGDCKGNSGITFDAAKTVYWNNSTSGLAWGGNTATWATSEGGVVALSNFPLAQDTAIIPSTPLPSGSSISLGQSWNIGTIDMSARTSNTMTLATSTTAPSIYGNWINGTGTTLSGTGVMTFAGRGSQAVTSAGKTFTQYFTINTPGGSVMLQDAFVTNVANNNALTLTSGTVDANGYNVTTFGVNANSLKTRTIAIGAGTWAVSGSGTPWSTGITTNLTVTGTGTISLTSASTKNFSGGSIQTYPTLNQGGAGALTVTGSNAFANITNTYSATGATTVRFTAGTTNIFTAFNLTGTVGKVCTLGSTTTAQATLQKSTAWQMGTNSTDSGNNTGLSFTAGGGVDYLNVSYINGTVVGAITSDVYYGATNITAIYYGSTPVLSLYYGTNQIF